MLNTIWKRYIFKELNKVFFFFLFCFFFLYGIVDYSTHIQDFVKDKHIQFADIALYYSCQFIKRADLLIPLALLIATIKVLCTMNGSRELVALQASGISKKKLFSPFFLMATFCCLFNLASVETLLPQSLNYLDSFRDAHFRHSFRGKRTEPFRVLHLKDGSKLIYQEYDAEKKVFIDVFWIRSFDDIWHLQTLQSDPKNPVGQYVDHLKRNKEGVMEKVESYELCRLSQLHWQANLPRKGMIPIENRKVSHLYKLLFVSDSTTKFQAKEILTELCFKCIMPFLSFLVVLGCTPFCVVYSRSSPVFFIYSMALFSFIAFFTLMDAVVILGKNNTFPPVAAILPPFLCCMGACWWKYRKTIAT